MIRALVCVLGLAAAACGGGGEERDGGEPVRSARSAKPRASEAATATPVEAPKTVADYETDAETSIDPDDLEAEVAKLEKEITSD